MAPIFHFSYFIANSLLQCFYTYFIFRAVKLPQRADRHLLRKLNIFTSVTLNPEEAYALAQEPAACWVTFSEAAPSEWRQQM